MLCWAHGCRLLVKPGLLFLETHSSPIFTQIRAWAPSPAQLPNWRPAFLSPQPYLQEWAPHSGGLLTRGSTSEVRDNRGPGCRARWMLPAPLQGRPQVLKQTPRTDSGLGRDRLAITNVSNSILER